MLLLDDVVSAVDAQTSKHIIQHCFNSTLMAGRTIIIASHAVESLAPLASHAVFLEDGKVVWTGCGPDLLESEHMSHLKTDLDDVESIDFTLDPEDEKAAEARLGIFDIRHAIPKTPKQLLVDEKRAKGAVDLHHWHDLKRFTGNNLFWTGMVALLFLGALGPVAERRVLE